MLDSEAVLKRKELVSHELTEENQLALFDSEHGKLIIMNELGRVVWSMLDGETSLDVIVHEIAEHVSGAPNVERVRAEVLEFAEQLLSRGAVQILRLPSER